MFTSVDKAIAGFLSSLLYMMGAFGMDVAFLNDQMFWLMPAMVMAMTYLVPNKEV